MLGHGDWDGGSGRRARAVSANWAGTARDRGCARAQDLTGVSEPLPVGVVIVAQVPFGTYFHALPW